MTVVVSRTYLRRAKQVVGHFCHGEAQKARRSSTVLGGVCPVGGTGYS